MSAALAIMLRDLAEILARLARDGAIRSKTKGRREPCALPMNC